MQTLQDRLRAFLSTINVTMQHFEKQCGIAQGLGTRLSEKSYATTFRRIETAYPNLNMEWLKTGEGEMIKPQQNRSVRDINGNSNFVQDDHSININELKVKIEDELANDIDVPANVEALQSEVKKLRQLLSKAEKEIARLEGKIEQQNETIKMLIGK